MIRATLAALVVAATATAAVAHTKSEQTTPGHEATVETVDVIEIRFDDPMRVTAITLTGPDGSLGVDRETGFDPVTEFRAKPPASLPAGSYTVEWRGMSADGHPMQGSFSFTVAE